MFDIKSLTIFWNLQCSLLCPFWKAGAGAFILSTAAGFIKSLKPPVFTLIVETFTEYGDGSASRFVESRRRNRAPVPTSVFAFQVVPRR